MNNDLLMRRIPFKTVANFRSLGGYAGKDGKVTKHGVLYRCAYPNQINEEDKQRIKRLGIKTSLDLRGGSEVWEGEYANSFVGDPDVEVVNIPLMDDLDPVRLNEIDTEPDVLFPEMYKMVFYDCGHYVRDAIIAVATALKKGAVVFNCAAGKDRTGLIAMLILMLCGVEDEDIIADYQVSDTYIFDLWPELIDEPHAKAKYMIAILAYIRKTYGDVYNCLMELGVPQEDMDYIVYKLLE